MAKELIDKDIKLKRFHRGGRKERPAEELIKSRKWKSKKSSPSYSTVVIWRDLNPEKVTAHRKVYVAIRNSTLQKLPCEECGEFKTQAHHDDYSKPLEVRWLCKKHHVLADKLRKMVTIKTVHKHGDKGDN